MKITEALSNVITEAGGTPTAEDADSVTHALGTLYTTLGGTGELPNDVAERINSLSDHIGGVSITLPTVTIVNSTSYAGSTYGFEVFTLDGNPAIAAKSVSLQAGATKQINVVYGVSKNANTRRITTRFGWMKGGDPSKLIATATAGNVTLARLADHDTSTMYYYSLYYNGTSLTEDPTITLSVTE